MSKMYDCFYSGKMPDEDIQEKIIDFIASYFDGIIIKPDLEKKYKTFIENTLDEKPKRPRGKIIEFSDTSSFGSSFETIQIHTLPFNFFGFIPNWGGCSQFVFDRNREGQIGYLSPIPEHCLKSFFPDRGGLCPDYLDRKTKEAELHFYESAYKSGDGFVFELMLYLIKARWWPDFRICDERNITSNIQIDIQKYGLTNFMLNPANNLNDCVEAYLFEEHSMHAYFSIGDVPDNTEVSPIEKFPNYPNILDYDMSIRMSNTLKKNNINILAELKAYKDEDLLKLKFFSRKLLKEKNELLKDIARGNTGFRTERRLYTIGTDGKNTLRLIKILKSKNINTVVDVRDINLGSEKANDRNTQTEFMNIARWIKESNIGYLMYPEILNPYGDTPYEYLYYRELFQRAGDILLKRVAAHATPPVCFIGENRLFYECHRKVISDYLLCLGYEVVHL